jgi:RNA-directed DNA polymerase
MDTVQKPMYEWNTIPWHKVEREVFKLQTRIYQASKQGKLETIHKLQRLLMKSHHACLLAVRRVTQDNQGKKTAGIDGVKTLTPSQRLELAETIKANPFALKVQPVRRVWIPKKGTAEKRPLGIPVMEDRARQALTKLALEPEWEARFEPNSYGFRPGRSAHDAIEAIFDTIKTKAKYVLDADISKCFDRINHQALLEKLNTFPKMRQLIKAWLKASIMDGAELFPSEEGTPQGGVISPLLANIALHGLETSLIEKFKRRNSQRLDGNVQRFQPTVVRYADDFVVIDRDEGIVKEAREFTQHWLQSMGLELKPSKTRLSHTLFRYEGKVGFDFLGFNIRQYPVGIHHSARTRWNRNLGFVTLIKPTQEAVKGHLAEMRTLIRKHKAAPQQSLISHLNPVISGWVNYYSSVCSKETFSTLDYHLTRQLLWWGYSRHPNKGKRWVVRKYWRTGWHFSNGKVGLHRHSEKPIIRHCKVKGARSPFDGEWVYWASRMGRHPEVPKNIAFLLKRQKGKCAYCGLYFREEDVLEKDHIQPKVLGGKDMVSNQQLLHRHCHDKKTAKDGSLAARGTRDKSHITEERNEAKVSRSVLKTSSLGDQSA